jgi:hypothetical protein
MRTVIMSAVVALSLSLSISAQTMSWNLVTSSSQNCEGCYNQALAANKENVQTVINTLADNVVNPSDLDVFASFISYYFNPHSYDSRHETGSRLIHLANVDSLDRLSIEIMSLYNSSDIGSDIKLATRTTPTIPAYTESTELNKIIASSYSLLPREKNESKRAYDKRIRTYAVGTYLIYIKHTTENLPETETAFAAKIAKKYN